MSQHCAWLAFSFAAFIPTQALKVFLFGLTNQPHMSLIDVGFLGAYNEKIFVFFMCFHGYLHFFFSFYPKNSQAVAYQKWN
jgi:hypothetical protein